MTSKERMLLALDRQVPDRLPATLHQWQRYHLENYMGGKSDLEAFRTVGLDAAITILSPSAVFAPDNLQSPDWRFSKKKVDGNNVIQYRVETPKGGLSFKVGYDDKTVWATEHLIKRDEDIYLFDEYCPVPKVDRKDFENRYDEIGDDGILRTVVFGDQAGCWQDACVLYGTEQMIMATFDKPEWVHEFLGILLKKKLRFVEESLNGLKVDLVETGGGAASNNVISPKIHREFCLPYDLRIHNALHSYSHKVVYHTCGGMMRILELIKENHCDASETLSPPSVGGDIAEPEKVKEILGSELALIGGMDQMNILSSTPDVIEKEVMRLFRTYGQGGGYIMSASDHFFDSVSSDNLKAYAVAAAKCVY